MPEPTRELESVEVRPIATAAPAEAERAAQAWVSRAQSTRRCIANGEVFTAAGHEFTVVTNIPGSTVVPITDKTEVSILTTPVPPVLRVQLTCLDDVRDSSEEALYQDYIRPLLLQKRLERKETGGKFLFVVSVDQVIKANGVEFGVRAIDPANSRYGALDTTTAVYCNAEDTPILQKVHVLPFEDTLPVAYSYNLFRDFLQPFFQAHPFAIYGLGDVFTYNGVRFRIMATDPDGQAARVSTQTMVYFQGDPLRQTVWDIMPPELREELQRLPRGLQMLLLNTMANEEAVRGRLTEVQEVLRRGQGLGNSEINSCGKQFTWNCEERRSDTQQTCMVCLSAFEEGDRVRELHCSHHFHVDCIDEWLRRSSACPICKRACGSSSGSGANILCDAIVICERGEGKVVGIDSETQMFRIQLMSGGQEILLRQEEFVQALMGVRLIGLRTEEMNGRAGQIVGFDSAKGRYQVALDNDRVLAVKPEHCILPDGAVARVEGLRDDGSGARWNGQFGRVVSFDRSRMRHVLAMQPRGQLLSVKAKNLRV